MVFVYTAMGVLCVEHANVLELCYIELLSGDGSPYSILSGITQECERRTVLVPEIILDDLWYFVPVSILTGGHLEVDPALPSMVPAKSSRYLKALVHYESPVTLEGSGILQLVHKVRKHQDRKVP